MSKTTTTLYVLYDMAGAPIYVGISHVPWDRMDQHREREWWQDVASAAFTHYPSRCDAEKAETTLIVALRPPGNRAWMPSTPLPHPSTILQEIVRELTAEELGLVTLD